MDPTYRLRTATRLHFLLLRRYGQDIDVGVLLKSKATQHDGLWLCRSTGDADLILLARQLARANKVHAEEESRLREDLMVSARDNPALTHPAAPGVAPRDMPWGRDTSGFGLPHHLQDLNAAPHAGAARVGRWLNPMQWLKGGAQDKSA